MYRLVGAVGLLYLGFSLFLFLRLLAVLVFDIKGFKQKSIKFGKGMLVVFLWPLYLFSAGGHAAIADVFYDE